MFCFNRLKKLHVFVTLLIWSNVVAISSQERQTPPQQLPDAETARDLFSQILGFLYTIAHWLGQVIVNVVQAIIPGFQVSASVVDPIGVLAVITVLMLIAEVSRKLIWLIITLGWVLIVIRLVMAAFQGGA